MAQIATGQAYTRKTFHGRTQKLVHTKPEIGKSGHVQELFYSFIFSIFFNAIDRSLLRACAPFPRCFGRSRLRATSFRRLFPLCSCTTAKTTIPESVASDGVDVRLPLVCFDPVHAEDQGHTVR